MQAPAHERIQLMSLRKIFTALGVFVLVFTGVRYLLPIALPFLMAALLALAAEPLVSFFQSRTKMPRGAATGVGVTMTLMLLALVLMVLVALLIRELGALAGVLPDLEGAAVSGLSVLEGWILGLIQGAPEGVGTMLTHSVQRMFSDSTRLLDAVTSWLLGLASGVVSRLPDSALGLFTWLLAAYMISAKLPQIRTRIRGDMPESWKERYLPWFFRLKGSVLGWLKAQCKLMGLTFFVLTAGLLLLQVPYAPVWGAVIAALDALPVLGTGMILVPWGIICFLQGDTLRGVGLLGVYAAAALLRSVLEPRLVGKQLGLDPLVTLGAMYGGYRLFGLPGMIFSPLAAVVITQSVAAGKIKESK